MAPQNWSSFDIFRSESDGTGGPFCVKLGLTRTVLSPYDCDEHSKEGLPDAAASYVRIGRQSRLFREFHESELDCIRREASDTQDPDCRTFDKVVPALDAR